MHDNAREITLSGAAQIGAITLSRTTSTTLIPRLTIDGNFTGSATINLHLQGASAFTDVQTRWNNTFIVRGAEGYAVVAADLAKFTLGNFFGSTSLVINQPISDTHEMTIDDETVSGSTNPAVRLVTK